MADIVESVAHITAEDGTKFQVLNADGTDWDEAATNTAYTQFASSISQ